MSPSRSRSNAREMPTVPASAMATHRTPAATSTVGLGPPRKAKQKTRMHDGGEEDGGVDELLGAQLDDHVLPQEQADRAHRHDCTAVPRAR